MLLSKSNDNFRIQLIRTKISSKEKYMMLSSQRSRWIFMKEQHIDDIANERTNEEPDCYVSRACRLIIRVRHHKIQAVSLRQGQAGQLDDGQDTH